MKIEKVDLNRLAELRVEVIESKECYLFRIPWGLRDAQYIEVGCLMSRLGEKEPIEIEFSDTNPSYLKYRVYFRKRGEANLLV
jgi:hypothetical protein